MITLNGSTRPRCSSVTGLVYAGTALYFRVPIPVQPLKAFAAAAIALHLSAETLAAGALLMAAAMTVLAAGGLADWLAKRFPLVLVRGIQASVALLLAKAAVDLAREGNWPGLPPLSPTLGLAMAIAACALLLACRWLSLPGSLLVLGGGAAVGLAVGGLPDLHAGPAADDPLGSRRRRLRRSPHLAVSSPSSRSPSATRSSPPPTPSRSYFGILARRVRPARLAASIGDRQHCRRPQRRDAPLPRGRRRYRPLQAGRPTRRSRPWPPACSSSRWDSGLGSSLPALLQVLAPGALAGMLAFVAIQHGLLAGQLERLDDRLIAGRRRPRRRCWPGTWR